MTKTRILIATVGGLTVAACGWLAWLMFEDRAGWWWLGTLCYSILLILTLGGMWQGKAAALRLSRFLALVMLGFGCWAAHFAWTFWLFQEPTFMDRILAVAHPRISVYLVVPAVWFTLSFFRIVRDSFKN